jgi:DNA transposition AAA+ family ATPase
MIDQSSEEIQWNEARSSEEKHSDAVERHARYLAESAAVKSALATIQEHKQSILARLAAGTVSIQRLQIVTGLNGSELHGLLDSDPGDVWNYRPGQRQAILDLAVWIKELDRSPEDDAAYAVTPTFQYLQALFAKAHQHRLLLAVTGAWGIGKTRAAEYYVATHPRTDVRPGAVRIQFDATDYRPVAVLEKILGALHTKGVGHRRGNVMNAIRSLLRPGDMLFLDECHRLKEALDLICTLHDECQAAIVMMGNPDFSAAVWGKRDTFGALASRANRFDFPAVTPDDVDAWLAWHGLPEGLSSLERSRLAKAAVAVATRPGQRGGLRVLADVMRIARNFYPDQLLSGDWLIELADLLKSPAQ